MLIPLLLYIYNSYAVLSTSGSMNFKLLLTMNWSSFCAYVWPSGPVVELVTFLWKVELLSTPFPPFIPFIASLLCVISENDRVVGVTVFFRCSSTGGIKY